jgi:hypothetical protein
MDPMTDQLLANDKNFPEVSIIMPRFNGGDPQLRPSAKPEKH